MPIDSLYSLAHPEERGGYAWYDACEHTAALIENLVPEYYRSRTFSGIIGDIKVLPPRKALSLISRKKGLGVQYARRYLTCGIDHGYGYQACASEALRAGLGGTCVSIGQGDILDVGCAIGVTAGVLGFDRITGFDLFPDLLRAARLVDTLTGAHHRYIAADMTAPWPFADHSFDTLFSSLVCHHLKEQDDVRLFFSEANRILRPGGLLIITLPAGSISRAGQLSHITDALERYGLRTDDAHTGLVMSDDNPHSLFWMFQVAVRKISENRGGTFIHPGFGFPEFRTPVTRKEKGDRARTTITAERLVRHASFRLIDVETIGKLFGEENIVFSAIRQRYNVIQTAEHYGD